MNIPLGIVFLLLASLATCAAVAGRILMKHRSRKRGLNSNDRLFAHLLENEFSDLVFNSLPDAFLLIDNAFTIVYVNDIYCQITGRSKNEVIGKRPPFPGWPTTNWDAIEDRVKDILAGKIKPFETEMYRKDGSAFPALFSVSKIFTVGDRTCYSVIIRDISERIRIEKALRRSEDKFRAQFMGLPIPLYTWQKRENDFVLIDHNDAADRVIGRKMANYLGMPASKMYKDRPAILAELHKCHNEKTSFQRDMSYDYMSTLETKHLTVTYAYVPPDYVLVHTEDRTARVEARKKLEASETRFRTAVESLPFGFFMIDETGRYSMCNRAIQEQWGHDIIGKTPEEIGADEETLALWLDNNRRAFLGETIHEEVSYTVLGEKRIFYNVISPVFSGDKATSIMGVNIDITKQKRIERELHDSDARLRLMAEQLPAIMWTINRDLRFTSSFGAGLEELNLEPGIVVGLSLYEYFKTDDPAFLPIAMHLKSLEGHPTTFEQKWNGHIWETHTEPLRDRTGAIIGCLAIALNITPRKKAEEISVQTQQQLRALTARLQEIREEESLILARRIHDDLGQALTGLRWDTIRLGKQMKQCSECDSITQFTEMVEQLTTDIDETIKRVREISIQLRPLILDDLGLLGAFHWQSMEFQKRTGIHCIFEHNKFDEKSLHIDSLHATVAFRILQEILNNVKRHSDARHIRIELSNEEKTLFFSVQDDGKGMAFNPERQLNSLGILGMRERAQSIGGEVRIESTKGKGTTVRVTIPI